MFVGEKGFPRVVVEVGYSETFGELQQDARFLLKDGGIQYMIAAKIESVKPNKDTVHLAFFADLLFQ